MKKHQLFTLLAFSIFLFLKSVDAQNSSFQIVNKTSLENIKNKVQDGNSDAKAILDNLVKQANIVLNLHVLSVTSKGFVPPSGDRHDYLSLAPYYWPDSTKPGTNSAYIRKDGRINPEIKKISDETLKNKLVRSVKLLGFAYYFTNDEKYATKATELLRGWFIDTATRMNPNLNYAQFIPGVKSGRGAGLIETSAFIDMLDAVTLIENSSSWTETDDKALKQWFEDFLNWMQTSTNGKEEHNSKTNHGTWYDAQIVSYALFINKDDFAKDYIKTSLKRIEEQFDNEGKQHFELTRTKALSYSTFNLEAWFKLATLADKLDIDLWHYTTPDGKSLKKAFDWLLPYALGNKKWEYKQIAKYDTETIYEMLIEASRHYKDDTYLQLARNLESSIKDPVVLITYSSIG
ncbi:hypothetical protein FC093_13940 [Ilyomonas limi]|uniref:Alginate lyase domain-containing protein n=1 Tax=Ilyomonas limi TaxID=2575867 RepID=A0A4U3KXS7_9BACT|nr:alginate lyase family protein [Ilyomonas limi]TKK67398.1 hypothetical protein FC093_13940 [Ilyomonas limi]